jgi:signal transduction histidine kinase/ActR/RegA family two-component response regulator
MRDFFSRLSIRFRLLLGFGLLGSLLLGVLSVSWLTLNHVQSNAQLIIDMYEPQVDRMTRVELLMVKISLEARHAILSANDPQELADAMERIGNDRRHLVELINDTEANLSTQEGRDIMNRIRQADAVFWNLSQQVAGHAQTGNVAAAYALLTTDLVPARNRQLEHIGEQKEWQRQLMNQALADASRTIDQVKLWLMVVVAGMLVFVSFLLLRLINSITRPLTSLLNTIVEVELSGDYTQRVAVQGTDEVAHTAAAFDRMMELVEARTNELARNREHLEEMVEQRTAELREAVTAAKAANEAKSRFLATMSHELRTPMNGVLGMAQLLLASPVDKAQTQDYARTILHSGQTLLTLLNDILDLSKIESGAQTLESGVVLPAELLRNTEALFANNAQAKGLKLSARWHGAADHRYRGDPNRLQQMLSNLTNNAIKFTSVGEVHIEAFELPQLDGGACLEFSVRDTGMGVPPEKQDMLFRPFSQIDNSTTRQFGGTGLGLSIVKNLAQLMGGEVGLESQEGQGSRFWFRVYLDPISGPLESLVVRRADLDSATLLPQATEGALGGRVLVVEDNRINQRVIEAMLHKLGVEVVLADNGQAAIDMVMADGRFTVVLMDVQMPVLDGYQATARIRAWEAEHQRAPLPIVAVTADAFADDQARCLQAGMNDFLPKPIKTASLAAMLLRWQQTAKGSPECDPSAGAPHGN